MACVGFEPTINEPRSHTLKYWTIRPWFQLAFRSNFVQLLQFPLFFSVMLSFGLCLCISARLFQLTFCLGNHMSVAEWNNDVYGILWNSYRKFDWVGLEPMIRENRSDVLNDWPITSWVQITAISNFAQLLQFHLFLSATFYFGLCLSQSPCLSELIFLFCWGNNMSVVEWTEEINGIQQ